MSSFFDNLEEGSEYVNITCSLPLYSFISSTYNMEDYQLNYITNKVEHNDPIIVEQDKIIAKARKVKRDRNYELNKSKNNSTDNK